MQGMWRESPDDRPGVVPDQPGTGLGYQALRFASLELILPRNHRPQGLTPIAMHM